MARKLSITKNLTYTALMAVLIVLCSWITVPAPVPFTLQTFGVFCAVGLLGGELGAAAVLLYLLMGVVGLPVFSGFSSGVGHLLGPTGGYIIGFLFSALVYGLVTRLFGEKTLAVVIGMALGLLVCYAFGTAWFVYVYSRRVAAIGLMQALGMCVFPFLIPDGVKIACAVLLVSRLRRRIRR
ncbi:MAG: biotin transporter BioY [Oscillospiraceae bacterium]|nr:biotin transporter BioY [Oscillospiraceae bacterium]